MARSSSVSEHRESGRGRASLTGFTPLSPGEEGRSTNPLYARDAQQPEPLKLGGLRLPFRLALFRGVVGLIPHVKATANHRTQDRGLDLREGPLVNGVRPGEVGREQLVHDRRDASNHGGSIGRTFGRPPRLAAVFFVEVGMLADRLPEGLHCVRVLAL